MLLKYILLWGRVARNQVILYSSFWANNYSRYNLIPSSDPKIRISQAKNTREIMATSVSRGYLLITYPSSQTQKELPSLVQLHCGALGAMGGAKATTTLFCLGQCLEIHQANMTMIEWFKYKTIYKEPRKYLCSGEHDTGEKCMEAIPTAITFSKSHYYFFHRIMN